MNNFYQRACLLIVGAAFSTTVAFARDIEEVTVSGYRTDLAQFVDTNPMSTITVEDMAQINATTVEDFLRQQPNLVVRRRYIGDPNGTLGIRGSNMFQTPRSMVFADGLPLHYHLQTRFSGAPRWSLVAPAETTEVETIYGPFSALYGGNAMGGVVNIKTRFPQEREFRFEASAFLQDYDYLGNDETYFGHREFLSLADKFGDLSIYLFHNHLESDSHPMSFFDTSSNQNGAIAGVDERGEQVFYFGDSGSDEVTTDLTKLKVGYDLGRWFAHLVFAYEERDRENDDPNSYVLDDDGGIDYSSSRFRVTLENRHTTLIGGGLNGPIGNTAWEADFDFSVFKVNEDERRRSSVNPKAGGFDGSGRVRNFDDTGWETLDLKFRNQQLFANKNLQLTVGYHYNHYELSVSEYNSPNFTAGIKSSLRSTQGGETMMQAGFIQLKWQWLPKWDVVIGGRHETWEAENGFFGEASDERVADRSLEKFSPKLALGYKASSDLSIRYSLAKAYRFPIVEELYESDGDAFEEQIANPSLKPEKGLHHNLGFVWNFNKAMLTSHLFYEEIEDVIFNQTAFFDNVSGVRTSVSSFLPIAEVTTKGLELTYEHDLLFDWPVDLKMNVAYTDAEITENSLELAQDIEGNRFPRIPEWRGNLNLVYHIMQAWDASVGLRYASNSFGRIDNTDRQDNAFGAQDSYFLADIKTSYRLNDHVRLGLGVDNINNDKAFVFHPWPQRTYYFELIADF